MHIHHAKSILIPNKVSYSVLVVVWIPTVIWQFSSMIFTQIHIEFFSGLALMLFKFWAAISKSFNAFEVCISVQKWVLWSAYFLQRYLVRTNMHHMKVLQITVSQELNIVIIIIVTRYIFSHAAGVN